MSLQELTQNAERSPTTSNILALFRLLRRDGVRLPELVVKYTPTIESSLKSQGDEQWNLYEQILIAHLDAGHQDVADRYLKLLQERFGEKSVRIQKLVGMTFESKREWESALALYTSLLESNPSDAVCAILTIVDNEAPNNCAQILRTHR